MLKQGKVKANEQKSGHNGAETIYNRCVEEKSEEKATDNGREGKSRDWEVRVLWIFVDLYQAEMIKF